MCPPDKVGASAANARAITMVAVLTTMHTNLCQSLNGKLPKRLAQCAKSSVFHLTVAHS